MGDMEKEKKFGPKCTCNHYEMDHEDAHEEINSRWNFFLEGPKIKKIRGMCILCDCKLYDPMLK